MWDISFAGQTITFLLALAVGAALCLLYDVFRILRIGFRPGTVAIFVQDILYWLLCAMVTFCLLIVRCSGEIRGYALLGELLGWIICHLTLSVVIVGVADGIFRFLRWLKRLILRPVRAFSRFFRKHLRHFRKFLWKLIKNTAKGVKKLLKRIYCLVYNCLKYKRAKQESGNAPVLAENQMK